MKDRIIQYKSNLILIRKLDEKKGGMNRNNEPVRNGKPAIRNDEIHKFIISEYQKWRIDLELSSAKFLLKKSISDEDGSIILEFSTDSDGTIKIEYYGNEIEKPKDNNNLGKKLEILRIFSRFNVTINLHNIYRNEGIECFGYNLCLKKFNDFVSLFPPDFNILSIGSGAAAFESLYQSIYKKQIFCIDPNPLEYMNLKSKIRSGKPFIEPISPNVQTFLKEKEKGEFSKKITGDNFLLLINWATPGYPYDLEAIELIKPAGFFVIYEEHETDATAGTAKFCEVVANKTDFIISGQRYNLIEKIRCDSPPDTNSIFKSKFHRPIENICIAFYRNTGFNVGRFDMGASSAGQNNAGLINMAVSSAGQNNAGQNNAGLINMAASSAEQNNTEQNAEQIILDCTVQIDPKCHSKKDLLRDKIKLNYHDIPIHFPINKLNNYLYIYEEMYEKSFIKDSKNNKLFTLSQILMFCNIGRKLENIDRLNEPNLKLVAPKDFTIIINELSLPDFDNISTFDEYSEKYKNKIEKIRRNRSDDNFLKSVYEWL